jgi:hypothetical protein
MLVGVTRRAFPRRAGFPQADAPTDRAILPKEKMMRMLVLLLIPVLALALAPTLVSERPVGTDALQFYSPGGNYGAKVEYASGNTEFVPFDRFELRNRAGRTVYAKSGGQNTVLDISDNGLVVGVDFDGPVSGRAKLHFYDAQGRERGTADIGFWDRHGFSTDGSVYCVLDGKRGLRVFSSDGKELYNAGPCNRFAVSPDGRRVALATDEAILLLEDGVREASIPITSPFIRGMAFSPDGERFGYCERRALFLHRVRDAALEFRYQPEDSKLQFISLDVGDRLVVAGLDLDGGRGAADRHRRGSVTLLDAAGAPAWQQELKYRQWNFAVPEVRFGPAGTFRVRTADAVREYRCEED